MLCPDGVARATMARRLKIKGLRPPSQGTAEELHRPALKSGVEVVDHVLESILPRYNQAQELFHQCVHARLRLPTCTSHTRAHGATATTSMGVGASASRSFVRCSQRWASR